jgi:hypothetical protein
VLLFAIEAGSIAKTIIYDHNIALFVWMVSFILFVFLTQVFFLEKGHAAVPGTENP